jgi:elongation factor 1-gamma
MMYLYPTVKKDLSHFSAFPLSSHRTPVGSCNLSIMSSSTPTYKLYSPAGSFRALAPLIVAEFNEISIEVVVVVVTTTTPDVAMEHEHEHGHVIATKSPTGKAPILECLPSGQILFSSYAISRYLAGLRHDSTLLGTNLPQRIAIDEWISWIACLVELPACILFYPIVGCMPYMNETATTQQQAQHDFAVALELLDIHLAKQQDSLSSSSSLSSAIAYLVHPEQISLADIVVVCTLLYPFKLVCDPEFLKPYSHVVRWFQHCVRLQEFVTVVGHVELYSNNETNCISMPK